MIEEEWFDIPNYENIYKINKKAEIKNSQERILKPSLNTSGYLKTCLTNNKVKKYFMIHQLMGLTFLKDYKLKQNKFIIDHLDNNKLNNNLENLRIVSFRENVSKDRKNKTSKYTGVSKNKINKKYLVYINTTGKNKYLGSFENEEDAAKAYNFELKKYLNNDRIANTKN